MSKNKLREFEASRYTAIRKSLIADKGSNLQRKLLKVALDNSKFLKWIRNEMEGKVTGEVDLNLFPKRLTEAEFRDTPSNVERIAFDSWSGITPFVASRPGFWACVTTNHVSNGVIDSSFLAAPGNPTMSGETRIELALKKNNAKMMDDVTRTILRRLSGLHEARGGLRSIYVNCPFGRSWWRERIIRETVELTGGDINDITRTLHKSQEYWEKLVNVLSSRNSVFGDEKIRSTLIWALSMHFEDPRYSSLFVAKGAIDRCVDLLGVYSAIQEFGVFDTNELREFIEKNIIEAVLNG